MTCPYCGASNDDRNSICGKCSNVLTQQAPPPGMSPYGANSAGGLIPYKNSPALTSYYLGLVSLFPFLGAAFGVAAVILGVKGLKKFKETHEVRGRTHAWVGLVCGALFGLFNLLLTAGLVAALLSRP